MNDAELQARIHFILGMPRAGTTFLYHNLAKHPGLFVPFRRKTNYFAVHFQKDRSWFLDHFRELNPDQIGIETDTLSFLNDEVCERMLAYFAEVPTARAILVVRDPAEWAISLYKQIASFTYDMPAFDAYLADGFTLNVDGGDVPFRFGPGDVAAKLQAMIDRLGERLLVIDFELVERDPVAMLRAIAEFFGAEPYFDDEHVIRQKINASGRSSARWLNVLLRQRWLIGALQRLVPRRIVVWLRGLYDRLTSRRIRDRGDAQGDWRELARERYAADRAWVRDYFATGSLLVNGRPFGTMAPSVDARTAAEGEPA